MLFNSYIYILVFLPLVATTYYVAGARLHRKLSIAWLVVASLFFYGWWNPVYLSLIIGSAVFNFAVGGRLGGSSSKQARLTLLIAAITLNLSLLGYFKYANFFIDNINLVFGTEVALGSIFLPLAISFFTFQQISFLIDSYRGQIKDFSFIHYMLFVTFFPQLIAGPIVHHAEMMPQFDKDETYKLRLRNIELGVSIFAIGLFKKVVIADHFSAYARPIFDAVDGGVTLTMLDYWLGAMAFCLQLYFDFSGYSDMAIGSARLFGIKLPINFYSPYKALNVAQLWRRWHMTLTRFVTAYVFMPMMLKRRKQAIQTNASEQQVFWATVAYPTVVTFLLIGVWHGAGWNFAIFGLLQGIFIVVNNLWQRFRKNTLKQNLHETTLIGRAASRGLTVMVATYSMVFFKAATTSGAMMMAGGMLGLDGFSLDSSVIDARSLLLYAAGGFSIIFLLPNTQQLFVDYEPSLEPLRPNEARWGLEKLKWKPSGRWAIYCSGLFITALLNMSKVSEFIYFQF